MAEASAVDVLGALALAGTLGAAGQVVRAIGGLKKMSDNARASGVPTFDQFSPSRFLVSLVVGFVAGMVAAFSLGLSKLIPVNYDNTELLLGLAAAGYGGTDFLEAFGRNLATRSGVAGSAFGQITKPAPAVISAPPTKTQSAPAAGAPARPPRKTGRYPRPSEPAP